MKTTTKVKSIVFLKDADLNIISFYEFKTKKEGYAMFRHHCLFPFSTPKTQDLNKVFVELNTSNKFDYVNLFKEFSK